MKVKLCVIRKWKPPSPHIEIHWIHEQSILFLSDANICPEYVNIESLISYLTRHHFSNQLNYDLITPIIENSFLVLRKKYTSQYDYKIKSWWNEILLNNCKMNILRK